MKSKNIRTGIAALAVGAVAASGCAKDERYATTVIDNPMFTPEAQWNIRTGLQAEQGVQVLHCTYMGSTSVRYNGELLRVGTTQIPLSVRETNITRPQLILEQFTPTETEQRAGMPAHTTAILYLPKNERVISQHYDPIVPLPKYSSCHR